MNADFIPLTKAKGVYARLDLESSVVDARRGSHKAYYSHFRLPRCGLLTEISQYLVNLERRLQEEVLTHPGKSAHRSEFNEYTYKE
jgi:hypothetical protein